MAKYFLPDGRTRDHLRYLAEALTPRLSEVAADLVLERSDSTSRCELRIVCGDRSCRVEHFYAEEYFPPWERVECQVAFLEGDQIVVMGETDSEAEMAEGIVAWLLGAAREGLAQRAPFAGAADLASERLYQAAKSQLDLATTIGLRKAKHENEFTVQFAKNERGCDVLCLDDVAELTFVWGETSLFTDQMKSAEVESILELVRSWVDQAQAPSEMRARWPRLMMSEAADCFEAGEIVAGEFFASWDDVFPQGYMWENAEICRLAPLICQLRELGFDRRVQAKRSGPALKLIRSRRGWRSGEPFVKIEVCGRSKSTLWVRFDLHEDPPRCGFRTYGELRANRELIEIIEQLAELPLAEGGPSKRILTSSLRRYIEFADRLRQLNSPVAPPEEPVAPNDQFREIVDLLTTSHWPLVEKLKEISPASGECADITIPWIVIHNLLLSAEFVPEQPRSVAKFAGKPEMQLLKDVIGLRMFAGILEINEEARVLSFAESFSIDERKELSQYFASRTGGMA